MALAIVARLVHPWCLASATLRWLRVVGDVQGVATFAAPTIQGSGVAATPG